MNICECCEVKLEAFIIVTHWGIFCSQECADAIKFYDEEPWETA